MNKHFKMKSVNEKFVSFFKQLEEDSLKEAKKALAKH